ncbi:hypothetical protein HJC23_012499 [Cyclotella cryptica]|uniref:Uncharacterized protein n=1 Tax=Cyclotella cryptica TaxID=29204 RepID=A0ABD3PC70_9STRA|eukprot:CCRYP_016306-RA/>CCRYP_016306-RA protein AED:0.17 eAED:0.17 QI:113/1/1/1/1/1/2/1819/708
MATCTAHSFVIFLLAILLLAVFSPTYGTSPVSSNQNSITSILTPSRSAAFLCRRQSLAQMFCIATSFLHLRGGMFSDRGRCDETTGLPQLSATDTNHQTTHKMDGAESEKSIESSIYASIGVINFSPTHHHQSTTAYEAKILICHKSNGAICNEYWGIYNLESEHPDDSDCNYRAAATTMGCLCHAIVLSLPMEKFSDNDIRRIDDTLLCIARGIVRRLKSVEVSTQKVMIPVTITLMEKSAYEQGIMLKKYIEQYLDLAVSRALELQKKPNTHMNYFSRGFKVEVSISLRSAAETAAELSERVLEKLEDSNTNSDVSVDNEAVKNDDGYVGVYENNLVPHSLFGVLLSNTHKHICKTLPWMKNNGNVRPVEWTKISDQFLTSLTAGSRTIQNHEDTKRRNDIISSNTMQSPPSPQILSPGFQEKVESLMAVLFVDAEESLNEIETRIDNSFFDLRDPDLQDSAIPEFGADFDRILNAISESFLHLIHDDTSLTGSDHQWANAQRLVTLKQITTTGIHRLFQSFLQNLRDHYGRMYEGALDKFSSAKGVTYERYRLDAARRAEEGFMKSAFDSIPQICRHPDGELCGEMSALYSCVDALRGLLDDMYEATSTRVLEEEEWEDIMDNSIENAILNQGDTSIFKERIGLRQLIKKIRDERRKHGPTKWYERLTAKALIIGVNYFQGWIILQSLRREARKRDLSMPKFPLF